MRHALVVYRVITIFLIIVLGTAVPSRAQQITDLPPVLSDSDVFTDVVTVVERFPVFEFDNDLRVIYYFDPVAGVWTTAPYPDELETVRGVVSRQDGTYIVGPDVANSIQWELRQEQKWLFDPAGNGFEPPDFTCRRIAGLPEASEWRVIYDPAHDGHFLCHTGTDERFGPLPEDIDLNLRGYMGPYSLPAWGSPAGVWVVFANGKPDITAPSFFSYVISTGEVIPLGVAEVAGVRQMESVSWHDRHFVIRIQEAHNTQATYFFQFDVAQPYSIMSIDDPVADEPDAAVSIVERDGAHIAILSSPDDPIEKPLPNAPFGKPNGLRVLIWSDTPTFTWGVTLYDVATDVQTPIIHSLEWELYILYTEWVGEDLLHVEIVSKLWTNWEAPISEPFTLGEWLIRIP